MLITVEQLAVRLNRTLIGSGEDHVEALLEDASALIALIVPEDLLSALDPCPASIIPVVVAMVRRGLDNPNGYTGESSAEYSYSGASGATLFATPGEVRTVLKAIKAPSGSVTMESYLPYSPQELCLPEVCE